MCVCVCHTCDTLTCMCFVWCCPGQLIKVSKLLSIPFSWSNNILLWVLTLGLFLAFVLMSHFPYNGDCHSMWTTSWYALEVSSKGMLKSNCCCDMLYGARCSEQWREWDIMTLVDKCCYLQAGLILIGVTLPHKRILLFVLSAPFLRAFSPCATLCLSCLQLPGSEKAFSGKPQNWEKECLVHEAHHQRTRSSLHDCWTSLTVPHECWGSGSGDLNWGSQLLMPKHSSPTEPWQCILPWRSTVLWIFLSLENTSSFMR